MAESKFYCFVPGCQNTSLRCPDKIFISVPQNAATRKKWFKASRRDMVKSPISPKSNITCCEDHFDLENDMENWSRYKFYKEAGFKANIRLKEGVVPHKFHCQPDRNVTSSISRTSVVEKLEKKKLLDNILSEEIIAVVVQDEIPDVETDQVCEQEFYLKYDKDTQTENTPMVDRAVQVLIKAHVRSKFIQTEQLQNISATSCPVDVATQMTPTKKIRLQSSSEDGTLTSTTTSGDGNEWVVHSSSSSKEEVEEIKKKIIQEKALEVTLHQIMNNPKMYVGITYSCYSFVIESLANRSCCLPRNILLLFKKIKLNPPFDSLGDDFGISGRQASRVFCQTLPKVTVLLKQLIFLPPSEKIEELLPIPFRLRYRKVQSIIDCFEVIIEKPSDPVKQSLTWSEYYKANTFKYLVSGTPNGFINFVSQGYGGRTTDTNLTKNCMYLNILSEGVQIMADRGFKHLAAALEAKGASLVRPPSVRSGTKLEKGEAKRAKQIASLRIHIERVIGRIRCYKMLSPESVIDSKLIRYLDAVVMVVAGLVNLSDPLFS